MDGRSVILHGWGSGRELLVIQILALPKTVFFICFVLVGVAIDDATQ